MHDQRVKDLVVQVATEKPAHKVREWSAANLLAVNALPQCGTPAAAAALRSLLTDGTAPQVSAALDGIIRAGTPFGYVALATTAVVQKAFDFIVDSQPDVVVGLGPDNNRLVTSKPVSQIPTDSVRKFVAAHSAELKEWFNELPGFRRFQLLSMLDPVGAVTALKSWNPSVSGSAELLVKQGEASDLNTAAESGFVVALRTFGVLNPRFLDDTPLNSDLKEGMLAVSKKHSGAKLNEAYRTDLATCAEWCERLARNAGPEFLHLVEREILAKRDQKTADWDNPAKKGSATTTCTRPEPFVTSLLSMAKEPGELGRVSGEHLLNVIRECGKHLCSAACKGDYGIHMLRQIAASNHPYAADARVELSHVSELGARSWGLLLPPSQRQLKKLATAALETI
jgi:hypothetical protein